MCFSRRVLPLCVVTLLVSGVAAAENYRFPIDTINLVLNYIAIDTSDLTFRGDWVDRDSQRLAIIDDLTARPLEVPGFLHHTARTLVADSSVYSAFRTLADLLLRGAGSEPPAGKLWTRERYALNSDERLLARGVQSRLLRELLDDADVALCGWSIDALIQGLNEEETAMIRDSFLILLQEEEKDAQRSLEELDSLQKLHDDIARRFVPIAEKINIEMILRRSAHIVLLHQELYDRTLRLKDTLLALEAAGELQLPIEFEGECGRIAIGGSGADRYEGTYSLIIDLGGDDEYHISSDGGNQIIIDLDGDDRYIAASNHAFGAGFLGCSILDDWGGNDLYVAQDFSLGCGIFGTGILLDRGGDDTYIGDIACQGAASFGVGLLIDLAGRDNYSAALYSQGFGFIKGAGALVEHSGNDTYRAGWKYGDILRYDDHYLSLSQGFGYGLRPHLSGGVGLLVDASGNDSYLADIFGQGASYWFALGGLIDFDGNDNYIAYQYAQGSATHLCLAALIDVSGNDLYSAKGVSQGCGHDLAFGLLLDCAGDDQYSATDLSQGAGSANGIGILIDLKGNDGHTARVSHNTHGYGNPRRDFGSIGLFLDLEGVDNYRGYGADNSVWVTPSKWGIGADFNSEQKK